MNGFEPTSGGMVAPDRRCRDFLSGKMMEIRDPKVEICTGDTVVYTTMARFETWARSSGYIVARPGKGEVVVVPGYKARQGDRLRGISCTLNLDELVIRGTRKAKVLFLQHFEHTLIEAALKENYGVPVMPSLKIVPQPQAPSSQPTVQRRF